MSYRFASSVLAFFAVVGTAAAQFQISEIQPGKPVMGPTWSSDKLSGSVVLYQLWGVNAPQSFGALKVAVRLHEELSPYGVIVIGPNLQQAAPEKVEAKAKSLGVRFAVTENIASSKQISINLPYSIIFEHTGKSRYDGPSDKAEAAVRTALAKAILDRSGKKTFSAKVQPHADAIKKGTPPGTVLPRLIPLQKSDPDAKALVEAMTAPAKQQIEDAAERVETDPVGVYNEAERISKIFKGTAVGTQANDLFVKLKNDKMVAQELKAHPSLEKLRKIDEALEKAAMGDDVASADFHKAHMPQITQIRMTVQQMKASWPKTLATAEAVDIAMKYGIMLK
jgi:hypothetical protein